MNTMTKSGSLQKPAKHLKKRRLSFEQKRQIAKLIVANIPRKVICQDWNISHSTLCQIEKAFVVHCRYEKYPDDPQMELNLEPLGSPVAVENPPRYLPTGSDK